MSYYVTNENSVLNINNAHLRVSGNVITDVMKLGAIEFAPPASNVGGTVNFTNVTTGVTTSSNLSVGGTLSLGTVEVVATTHTLANTTANGNVTPHTVQFSNATTGIVTTANVEVGGELTVSGNVAVDTDTLFVDSVNDRVGVGTNAPGAELHVAGTGAIVVPSGTTAQQPTGVAGMIRFNTTVGKLELYNGTVWSFIGGVSATGGAVTNVGGYTIHTFTSSGTFTVVSGGEVEYLVVAGGGGGGSSWEGGGGGAGGLMNGTLSINNGSYTITVGEGGVGGRGSGTSNSRVPTNGSNSSFSGFVALGGGVGGQNTPEQYPTSGGSGGGGTHTRVTPGNAIGSDQFGNAGGLGIESTLVGAGGGGAGAVGQGPTVSKGGDGGVGLEYFGSYYAGGGGGGRRAGSPHGVGGNGGGGNGGTAGASAASNTGGGGGGGAGGTNAIGGNGGSGIVIIRYLS